MFEKIDALVEARVLTDVVAQIGRSSYQPRLYHWRAYLPPDELQDCLRRAALVICHAGAGTLNECLGLRKKVIVVPRLARYGEGPDDHQLEIAEYLADLNRVLLVRRMDDLETQVKAAPSWQPAFVRGGNHQRIATTIRTYIEATHPSPSAAQYGLSG